MGLMTWHVNAKKPMGTSKWGKNFEIVNFVAPRTKNFQIYKFLYFIGSFPEASAFFNKCLGAESLKQTTER